MEKRKIKRALVSVFHKENLDKLILKLHAEGVEFISTGGTKSFIESLEVPCTAVEDLTGYPSILGGRVKTLHPKVFGGILSRRKLEGDMNQLAEYDIPEIDLVIVDLYPFEATVASEASEQEIIEKTNKTEYQRSSLQLEITKNVEQYNQQNFHTDYFLKFVIE